MRAVLQRVSRAGVRVAGEQIAEIGPGILVLLGVAEGDGETEAEYLAGKTAHLRIFEDRAGKMNLSVLEVAGEVLVVSQFTLLADCRKGRRPGFALAARPEAAEPLCRHFVNSLQRLGLPVQTGRFQAEMAVALENDGPVTLVLDSQRRS